MLLYIKSCAFVCIPPLGGQVADASTSDKKYLGLPLGSAELSVWHAVLFAVVDDAVEVLFTRLFWIFSNY